MLPKRFGKYGLTLHPEKTRMVSFQGLRPGAPPRPRKDRPGTFDFLGFTHYWGRTLKGNWTVKRKTAKDRFRRSLKSIARWCREHRHLSPPEQWAATSPGLTAHRPVNAIPYVCAAEPGIRTTVDLPQVIPTLAP